jgi:hypothetical protein
MSLLSATALAVAAEREVRGRGRPMSIDSVVVRLVDTLGVDDQRAAEGVRAAVTVGRLERGRLNGASVVALPGWTRSSFPSSAPTPGGPLPELEEGPPSRSPSFDRSGQVPDAIGIGPVAIDGKSAPAAGPLPNPTEEVT